MIRFPDNIATMPYCTFQIKEFKGYDISMINDPQKFNIETNISETVALPLPDQLQSDLNASYGEFQSLSGVLGDALESVTKSVSSWAKGLSGADVYRPTGALFQNTSSQTHIFSWSNLIPETSSEAQNIEDIASALRKASLPNVASGVLALSPDVVLIKIKDQKFFTYIDSFITNVSLSTNTSPVNMYQDGHFPSYSLTVQFLEVTARTKQIESSLR